MNTPITSDNLLLTLSKKLENQKISELLNKNKYENKINKNEKNKIEKVVENFIFIEQNFIKNQKLDFLVRTSKLVYTQNQKKKVSEKIKLGALNFDEILEKENFFQTQIWNKIKKMIFVFYIRNINWKNSKIIRVVFLDFDKHQNLKKILNDDYQTIRKKIFLGKAHELSEGDTKFLGVSRIEKQNRKAFLEQPYSIKKIYPRHFVFNQIFLQILYENNMEEYQKNITQIEQLIKERVQLYKNKPVSYLMEEFRINKLYPKIKEDIFFKILNVGSAVEFNNEENTNFNFFTITLNNKDQINNRIKINFNLMQQLRNPKTWEDSETFREIEKTSYVLIYKEGEKNKLNPKIVDIKKMNFSDETVNLIKEQFKKEKEALKKFSKKSRIKDKYIYIDSNILQKELKDF